MIKFQICILNTYSEIPLSTAFHQNLLNKGVATHPTSISEPKKAQQLQFQTSG